ncbi:MAG: trypco2 family protein [Mycobacteriales bacterium]
MAEIGLAEAVSSLRTELLAAMDGGADAQVRFPVGEIQMEFQIAVARADEVKGGLRFWVVEAGAGSSFSHQEIHRLTVSLGPPVDERGQPVKVARGLGVKP